VKSIHQSSLFLQDLFSTILPIFIEAKKVAKMSREIFFSISFDFIHFMFFSVKKFKKKCCFFSRRENNSKTVNFFVFIF